MLTPFKSRIYKASTFVVACVLAVSLLVILGWFIKSRPLTQILPTRAPMQFNSALILLLTSLAVLFQIKQKRTYVLALSFLVFVLSILIAVQYIYEINLGIDTLVVDPFVTVKTSDPGRSSPTTLIFFMLLSASLIIFTIFPNKISVFIAVLAVSCVTALSLFSLLSFIDSRFNFEWHNFTKIPLHSAASMLALSIVLTFIYILQNDYLPLKKLLYSFSLFIFLETIALIFWMSFAVQEQENIERKQRVINLHILEELEQSIISKYYVLTVIETNLQNIKNKESSAELKKYLEVNPQVSLVGVVDPDLKWSYFEKNNPDFDKPEISDFITKKSFKLKKERSGYGGVQLKLTEINNMLYILIASPLYKGNDIGNYLVAIYRMDPNLEKLLTNPKNEISLLIDRKPAYGKKLNEEGNIVVSRGVLDNEIVVIGNRQSLFGRSQSLLPEFAGFGGTILAIFASIALYQYQTAKEKYELINENVMFTTAILNSMDDGVIIILNEGKKVSFNPKTLELFQAAETEFLEWFSIENLLGVYSSSQHPIQSSVRHLLRVTRAVEVFHRPNGCAFIAEYTTRNIIYEDEIATVIVFDDISERLETQRKLQESLTELTERNVEVENARIHAETASQAKSYFLANISHELRTPLNGIIGIGELLEKTKLNEKQRNYVQMHQSSADTLNTLINDILTLAKIESGSMLIDEHVFTLQQLLSELETKFSKWREKKQIDLEFDYPFDQKDRFIGDSYKIKQILNNLISNAIKFTIQGKVTCKVQVDEIEKNKYLVNFAISDTGIGIAQKDLPSLFTLFTQLDVSYSRKFEGTGLGLAIVLKLSDLIGGKVKVLSELSKGSTFIFSVPLKGA